MCTIPITRCTLPNGKQGFRWGQQGKCYENGQDAAKQGIAASGGPDKFKKIMKSEGCASTDWVFVKAAIEEYEKDRRSEKVNAFSVIAQFLSAKADDGQMDSDTDKGDMLDGKDCKGSDYVDNAGENSNQYKDTGDGLASGKVDGVDPARKPVVNDDYKSGDECKQPTAAKADPQDGDGPDPKVEASVKDGKPDSSTVDTEDTDNNKNGLDKENVEVAANIVKPPYNKSASPETPPGRETTYDPPSRKETTPANTDNRKTLDSKVQYQVKSDDKMFDMDDDEGMKAKCGSINELTEKEDILTKKSKGDDIGEADMNSARCEEIWNSIAFISQHERDSLSDDVFCGPHRSFPLRGPQDLHKIASLLHHAQDPSGVKRKAINRAKKMGWSKSLPESWLGADEKSNAQLYDQAVALFEKLSPEEKKSLANNLQWEEMAVNKPDEQGEV